MIMLILLWLGAFLSVFVHVMPRTKPYAERFNEKFKAWIDKRMGFK